MGDLNDPNEQNERLYNAVENVLARLHKRESPAERMAMIRARYPSPVFFIESNAYTLRKLGLPRLDAFFFSIIPELTRLDCRESFGKRPRLNKLSIMSEYLKSLFIGVHVECFYAILLDSRGYLIQTALIRKGTTDTALFYLKDALSLAVQREAKAIVLCHNHPRGTLRPSQEDINCTLSAINAFASLGIPMLDHVIIARDRAVSMRDCGSVPTRLWDLQQPSSKLLREWIDVNLLEDQP